MKNYYVMFNTIISGCYHWYIVGIIVAFAKSLLHLSGTIEAVAQAPEFCVWCAPHDLHQQPNGDGQL